MPRNNQEPKEKVNRPTNNDFTQLRLKSWPPVVSTLAFAMVMIVIGIIFIPTGLKLLAQGQDVHEYAVTYDDGNGDQDCYISSSNQGKSCKVTFTFRETITDKIYVYYQLENFFQNHRRYYQSRSIQQLQGDMMGENDVSLDCDPLYKNGSQLLNPCGLIANSFFNDEISVNTDDSTYSDIKLDETGIALSSDRISLYNQVNGFEYAEVTDSSQTCEDLDLPDSCKDYTDTKTGTSYKYYYPKESSTQYLYETYPNQISPIKGVTDEHFIVWMRVPMLPTFRKLYGTINRDFEAGDKLVFDVVANYEVGSFDAKKTMILSTKGDYGARNIFPGQVYITIGSFALAFGIALFLKEKALEYAAK